jgi:hypothetical protein
MFEEITFLMLWVRGFAFLALLRGMHSMSASSCNGAYEVCNAPKNPTKKHQKIKLQITTL